MKIKSNRFALFPILCTECQRYIWLEPYRKGEKWHIFADRFLPVNICKDCYSNFKFGEAQNDKKD